MKPQNTLRNLPWLGLNFSLIWTLIFYLGLILGNTAYAAETLRPTAWTDYAGKTSNSTWAIDGDLMTKAKIITSVDAFPSIIYHSWQNAGTQYASLTLCVDRTSSGHVDDKWGIKYSTNGGQSWLNLDGMSARNIETVGTACLNLDPSQDLNSLQARIDTDRNKGADNGLVYIYDIRIEAEPLLPPILEQSGYRFFKNIDSVDLTAIVSDVGGADEATAITVIGEYMYIAGFEPGRWRIEKRHIDDGYLEVTETNDSWGTPRGIATDGTHLYLIGDQYSEGNYRWRLEKRYLSDLSLVGGFGTNGIIISDPSPENDSAFGIAIYSDVMYIVGSDRTNGAGDAQWRVEMRYLADGSLVNSICNNPSTDDDIPFGIAVDSDYIYIVGYNRIPGALKNPKKSMSQSDAEWRIEKRSRLTLDSLGEVTSNPTDNFDTAKGVAIEGDSMYVIGSQEVGFFDTAWRIEKRYLSDLSLVTAFGDYGAIVQDIGYDDQPEAIAIDSSFMYVVGYSAPIDGGGDTAWRTEKRDLASGNLDYSITNDINSDNNDRARAIAVDSASGHIYIAGYNNPGLSEWRIEKRHLSNGSFAFLEPLASQNVPATLSNGNQFRLRILIHVISGTLLVNAQQFKLQFSRYGSGTWYDVTDATEIAFTDNPTPWNGDALLGNPEDPTLGGFLIKNQSYVEANSFTNPFSTIETDEVGMWDFPLIINSASPGTYLFKVVKWDGTGSELDGYVQIPQVDIH